MSYLHVSLTVLPAIQSNVPLWVREFCLKNMKISWYSDNLLFEQILVLHSQTCCLLESLRTSFSLVWCFYTASNIVLEDSFNSFTILVVFHMELCASQGSKFVPQIITVWCMHHCGSHTAVFCMADFNTQDVFLKSECEYEGRLRIRFLK